MSETATATPITAPTNARTIREILGIHDLLVFLGDGHTEIVKGEDGKPTRGKTTTFTFDAKARYAVLYNRSRSEKVAKRVQTIRDARITELSSGTGSLSPDTDADKIKLLQTEIEDLLNTTEAVEFRRIPLEGLRLDANPLITDSIVLALGDLVSEPAA